MPYIEKKGSLTGVVIMTNWMLGVFSPTKGCDLKKHCDLKEINRNYS